MLQACILIYMYVHVSVVLLQYIETLHAGSGSGRVEYNYAKKVNRG